MLCCFVRFYKGFVFLLEKVGERGVGKSKKDRLASDLEFLGEGADLLAVQEGPDAELGTLGASEGIHAGVGAIVVVGVLCLYLGLSGALDLDVEVIAAKGLLLLPLVVGLDGEGEDAEAGVGGICTFLALNLPGGVLDGLALEVHRDVVGSGLGRVELDIVGAVVVVLDVGVDVAMGAVDLHVEVIATVSSGLALGIDGVDGELAGLVIDEAVEGGTLGPRVGGIGGGLDVDPLGGVLDGLLVQGGVDVVVAGVLGMVLHGVGTIVVVGDAGLKVLRAGDLDLEGIAAIVAWLAIGVDGVDGEHSGLQGLTALETGSLRPRVASAGGLDEHAVGAALDGLLIEGDVDKVVAGGVDPVGTIEGTVVVVLKVGIGDLLGALHLHNEGIASVLDVVALGVDRVYPEGRILAGSGTLHTGAGGIRVAGLGALSVNRVRAALDVLTPQLDADGVFASLGDGVLGGVLAVAVVADLGVHVAIRAVHGNVEYIAASGQLLIEAVLGDNLEVSGGEGLGPLQPGSVGIAESGIGGPLLPGKLLALSASILASPVAESSNVGHQREFVRGVDHVNRVHENWDLIFLEGGIASLLSIPESIIGQRRHVTRSQYARLQRVNQSANGFTILPTMERSAGQDKASFFERRENILGSEVAQGFGDVVGFYLFPDPFQQFPFG